MQWTYQKLIAPFVISSSAENRIPIVAEGVLKTLITYVNNEDNDMIGRQYCAMAIGNLASEREPPPPFFFLFVLFVELA